MTEQKETIATPTPLALCAMDEVTVDKLTTAQLAELEGKIAVLLGTVKTCVERFEGAKKRRFGIKAAEAYAKKKSGKAIIDVDGEEVELSRSKKVIWDQARLLAWLDKRTKSEARHYGKLQVEVPAAKFNNAPPDIKKELQAMRTEQYGEIKYKIQTSS